MSSYTSLKKGNEKGKDPPSFLSKRGMKEEKNYRRTF